MLISVGDTPAKPVADESPAQVLKSISPLRIGAGMVLAWFHGWPGAVSAYQFLWKEQPWEWVAVLDKARIPYPHLVAPAVALVIAAIATSWILGFVTRLFSAVAIPVVIGGLIIAHRLESTHLEACALYLPIAVTLLLFGSGNISLDFFFRLGQKAKEQPKRR